MSPLGELESSKFVDRELNEGPQTETGPPSRSWTNSLEVLLSRISIGFILFLVFGAVCWLMINREQLVEGVQDVNNRSFGEWVTGKTWEQKRAEHGYGPFDSVFYPESEEK